MNDVSVQSKNPDFDEIANVVAQMASAYKAAKADGHIDTNDLSFVLPVLMLLPAAIKGAPDAFKGLDAAAIKEAATKILSAAGEFDGKVAIYVEEGFNIVAHGVGIFESIQKIVKA